MIIRKPMDLAPYIDHTLLLSHASKTDIIRICDEASKYRFAAVCVNPYFVPLAKEALSGSEVKICTVIGFPLGAVKTEIKEHEAKSAVQDGADELDMVINISAVKNKDYGYAEMDIRRVVEAVPENVIIKVILEVCYLAREEIKHLCDLSMRAGADFVKTSTGFGSGGATFEALKLMKDAVGEEMGIKAAGGIKDFNRAKKMIEGGATRIGTSSALKIIGAEPGGPASQSA
jgi:deoxyribose-phosphate aldolase